MSTTVSNTIERELDVNVPPAEAWPALVEPDLVGQWFGRPSQRLQAGAEVTLRFEMDSGVHEGRALVTDVEEGSYVAFSWLPGMPAQWEGVLDTTLPLAELPTTRVEFRLEPVGDGSSSRITVVESGFAELPAEVAAKILAGNEGGWEYCFSQLAKVLDASAVTG
jgi:uncharacterized protein YndB with AHSA1/START domain